MESIDGWLQPEPGVTQLYSDGLGLDGQVGAAVVLLKQGEEPKSWGFTLGQLLTIQCTKRKLVALLLALHLLPSERSVTMAVIQLDNQAVLHALTACESGPAQSILDKVILQIELIANAARVETFWLNIVWVSWFVPWLSITFRSQAFTSDSLTRFRSFRIGL